MAEKRFVKNACELINSCNKFQTFWNSHRNEFQKMLKNNVYFVVQSMGGNYTFTPFSYAAYYDCSMEERLQLRRDRNCRGSTEHVKLLAGSALIDKRHEQHKKLDNAYKDYCERHAVKLSQIKLENELRQFYCVSDNYISYPDEITEDEGYQEGATKQITVNAYERNPTARLACIKYYNNAYKCEICEFNFKDAYGELGQNFIHVHHLIPLSEIKEEYSVDPKKDLLPVCCNCHAMLHRNKKTLSPGELRKITKN